MLVWILVIVIAIIVIVVLWWYHDGAQPQTTAIEEPPTMHARCRSNSACGGDLVCDVQCHRCKQKVGGNCAVDVDCESGLRCHDWKCIPFNVDSTGDATKHSSNTQKPANPEVHWDDAKNETFYI